MSAKDYLKINIIPFLLEILFIASCFAIPKEYYIYTNTLFYVVLFVYYRMTRKFAMREWLASLKGGKKFWKQVILTAFAFFAAFGITMLLENVFPEIDTGSIPLIANTWLKLICFIISTVLLPAVTEETFFPKEYDHFQQQMAACINDAHKHVFVCDRTFFGLVGNFVGNGLGFTLKYFICKDQKHIRTNDSTFHREHFGKWLRRYTNGIVLSTMRIQVIICQR